jgi:hypothetical protein
MRWGVLPADIVGWALEGHLDISIALPPVQAGGQHLAGLCAIDPADIFPMFRRDGSGPATIAIRRARTPECETDAWAWISEPAEGVLITQADVLITRRELERFEEDHEPFAGARADSGREQARRPGGPGAPARYDWDAFYAALLRRLYDDGMPKTQSELVRDMQDWFDRQDASGRGGPDESTIRRKVQAVWRELQQGAAR